MRVSHYCCKKCKLIKKIYVSTDCKKIKKNLKKYKLDFVYRPKELASDQALGDDVFKDAYKRIKEDLNKKNKKIEFVVLLMANAATINSKLLTKGINILRIICGAPFGQEN